MATRKIKLNPGMGLSREHREYVHARKLLEYGSADAYRYAYDTDAAGKDIERAYLALEARAGIKRYKAWLDEAEEQDIILAVYQSQLLDNDATVQQKKAAADALDKIREREDAGKAGAGKWLALMRDLEGGPEMEIPIPIGATHVNVRFEDFLEGRYNMVLPLAARVDLLHRAGAPWSEDDPDAKLSELQIEMLGRRERTKILLGGSGLGKSALGGCEGLSEVVLPRRRICILADTYDHCHDEFKYIYEGWINLFGYGNDCGKSFCINERAAHKMSINTIWGSSVTCISTDKSDGDALLGKEFDLIILGEGAKVKADTYQRKAVRALNRRIKVRKDTDYLRQTGRTCMYTTADGYNGASSAEWDTAMRVSRGDPAKLHADQDISWLSTYYLREASVHEAPHYSPEAIADAERRLPPDIFAEQYLGKRVRRSGIIYKEFDRDKMIVPRPERSVISTMNLSLSMDTGKHYSSGLHGYHPDGSIWRLGEFCQSEANISDNCIGTALMCVRVLGPIVGINEPPSPTDERAILDAWERVRQLIHDYWIDSQSQHKLEVMKILNVGLADAKFSVQGTIDQVRKVMDEGRFFVARNDNYDPIHEKGFIYEVQHYSWQVVKVGNAQSDSSRSKLEPIKVKDHSMDDARYGIIPLLDAGPPSSSESVRENFSQSWEKAHGFKGLAMSMRNQMMKGGNAPNMQQAFRRIHGL